MAKSEKKKHGCLIGAAVMVALIVLVGVAGSSGDKKEKIDKDTAVVQNDSDTNDSKKQLKSDTKKASDTVSLKKQTLWEVDGVKITTDGIVDDSIFGKAISVKTENNSKKDIGIGIDALIVNDYMFTDLTSIEAAAGKKASDKINLFQSDLEKAGIENIGKIELYMHTFNPDTYNTIKKSKCITLKTSAYNKMDTKANIDGALLYNQKGVKIYAQYVDEDSFWGKSLLLYIENHSKKNIIVQCDKLSVNGYMITDLFSCDVYKGKKCFDSIELLQSELDENNITEIKDIETKFEIMDTNFHTVAKSGKVKLKLK